MQSLGYFKKGWFHRSQFFLNILAIFRCSGFKYGKRILGVIMYKMSLKKYKEDFRKGLLSPSYVECIGLSVLIFYLFILFI